MEQTNKPLDKLG